MGEGIKKLIIAPHSDDEVLGCGGIIDEESLVFYCGIDETKVKQVVDDPEHRIPKNSRMQEIKAVCKFLKCKYHINSAVVNHYEMVPLIVAIEKLINEVRPDKIFIPSPFSYNQDHKIVYKACKVALRPHDQNFFVKKVLVYEQPSSMIFERVPLTPNYFVPVDIEKKLKAYSLQPSQVRKMRSPEILKAIAKLRGASCNCEYAEGFHIERWLE